MGQLKGTRRKNKPANVRYKAAGHREKNKIKRIAKAQGVSEQEARKIHAASVVPFAQRVANAARCAARRLAKERRIARAYADARKAHEEGK